MESIKDDLQNDKLNDDQLNNNQLNDEQLNSNQLNNNQSNENNLINDDQLNNNQLNNNQLNDEQLNNNQLNNNQSNENNLINELSSTLEEDNRFISPIISSLNSSSQELYSPKFLAGLTFDLSKLDSFADGSSVDSYSFRGDSYNFRGEEEELNLEIEYNFDDNEKIDYELSNNEPSNNEPSNYEPSNYEPSNNEPSNYELSNYELSNNESSNNEPSNYELSNNESSNYESSNTQSNTQSTNSSNETSSKLTSSSSENTSIGIIEEFFNLDKSIFNSQIINIHKDEPMNLQLINLDIDDSEPIFKRKCSPDSYNNSICFNHNLDNSSQISNNQTLSCLNSQSNENLNLFNSQISSSSSSAQIELSDSSSNSTESSNDSDIIFSNATYLSPNSQLTTKRELAIDNFLDDKIKKTILIRLEILMKTLYGKGLFFMDKIMIAKKCWENSKFEGKIRMNLKENDELIYQRLSHMKRVSLLFMACKIYILVLDNKITTRRNIYYEHKDLFSVTTCYNLIEMICSFVNLSRRELNIISTGKGLVAGNLIIEFENDSKINGADYRKGFLIPDSLIFTRNILTNANYVLVVEKDAIFNKLIDDDYHLKNNIIIITSKGYPDVYTRELVNLLSEKFNLKIFGIFDCDPFGLDIYCCFKFGSFNLIHHSKQITSPKMIWLGIYPSEILFLKLKYENFSDSDERRSKSLLKRVYLKSDPFLSNEIFILNQIKIKSGLQDLNDSIFAFIQEKVFNNTCVDLDNI